MAKQKTAVLLAALLFGTGFSVFLPAAVSADADGTTALTTQNADLFLPASYEQYLLLENPSHVAVNEVSLAVADGSSLYVYDRASGEYSCYVHTTGADNTETAISELQFASDGSLYFTDQSTGLYRYENGEALSQGVSCATFLIEGDVLYYATSVTTNKVTFYYLPLSSVQENTTARKVIGEKNGYTGSDPHLAYGDGMLYCAFNANTCVPYDTASKTASDYFYLDGSAVQISGLSYLYALGGSLYYTVNGGAQNGLYRTDTEGNAEYILEAEGLSTLTAYNGVLYAVKNSSVVGIDVSEDQAAYTGWEISASSDSENRLSGATDTVRAGGLLVTADAGNRRVSVYSFETAEYSVIACDFTPELVATDGETVAVSGGSAVYTLTYGESAFTAVETFGANVTVVGLVCSYGSVYYVTANGLYGLAGGESVYYAYGIPSAMTMDLYGTLYVCYQDGSVYAFGEEDFTETGSAEKLGFSLPSDCLSLRADFEGNLYCLSERTLYKNGTAFASLGSFVYGDTADPVSFALGFEDDCVYFCFGSYTVASGDGALDIPTLGKIALGTVNEQVFSVHGAEGLFVDIPAGSVGVITDLSALQSAEAYFPYGGYLRTEEKTRDVLLASVGVYALVAVCQADGSYTACLYRAEKTVSVSEEEYYAAADGSAYLSNAVSLSRFPCLDAALRELSLARGTAVSVLGTITAPESGYALVELEADGETYTGYVPLSYLSDVSPLSPAGETYTVGYLKASEEGVSFEAEGDAVIVQERVSVRLYDNGDGTYTAQFDSEDGTTYSAQVTSDMIDFGESDVLRISLIVILSVVAILIVGVYVYMLPRKKRNP